MALTHFAPNLGIALQLLEAHDINPKPLLRKLSIDPRSVNDPNARFRLEQVLRFYEGIEALAKPQSIWLEAGRYWHPAHLGSLGYGWLSSSTLRTALMRFVRFSKIVSEGFKLQLTEDEKAGVLSLRLHLLQPERAPWLRNDGAMSVLLAMLQANAGPEFYPKRLVLAHPDPESRQPYEHLFQCPIEFQAPVTQIDIDLEEADKERPVSDRELTQLHDQMMLKYLARLNEDNIIERVKMAIIEQLPSGRISDARIAKALYMNRRTLQRRLQAQGTTFKSILTEVRQELAEHYLQDPSKSLSEIAYLLGFSELSAFSRAYKRWAGAPPKFSRKKPPSQ